MQELSNYQFVKIRKSINLFITVIENFTFLLLKLTYTNF